MTKTRFFRSVLFAAALCTALCWGMLASAKTVDNHVTIFNQSNYHLRNDVWMDAGAICYFADEQFYVPASVLEQDFGFRTEFNEETGEFAAYFGDSTFAQQVERPFIVVNGTTYDDYAPLLGEDGVLRLPLLSYLGAIHYDAAFSEPADYSFGQFDVHFTETVPDEWTQPNVSYKRVSRIVVNKTMQMVIIYGIDAAGREVPIRYCLCSTGLNYSATPDGIFRSHKLSYGGTGVWYYFPKAKVWITYCSQIVGDVCFHSVSFTRLYDANSLYTPSYLNLGSRASAGCVRLLIDDARFIWENCNGVTVEIGKGYYSDELQKIKNTLISQKPSVSDYIKLYRA